MPDDLALNVYRLHVSYNIIHIKTLSSLFFVTEIPSLRLIFIVVIIIFKILTRLLGIFPVIKWAWLKIK